MMTNLLRWLALLAMMLCLAPAWAASDRHVFFVSDLHVGAGKEGKKWKQVEDFRWQADFDSFLDWAGGKPGPGTDLVFVGDTFELWQSPTMVCSGDFSNPQCRIDDCNEAHSESGCTEDEALARFEHVLNAHPDFVDAVRRFAGKGRNRVFFIPGNHDAALLFPKVRAHLLRPFQGQPVSVMRAGYWISADGAILSDHGHQFDDLNTFKGWPAPFVTNDGVQRLRKPWGENMVQQFYNQYEFVFPIVDNLSDEMTGINYALEQANRSQKVVAIRKLFRFLLWQQSTRQAGILLGDPGKAPVWDHIKVKEQPPAFFVEALKKQPELYAAATEALANGGLEFDPKALSEVDIDAICITKSKIEGATECPTTGQLGAIYKNWALGREKLEVMYLTQELPRLPRRPGPVALYVFAHTHSSFEPTPLSLGEMKGGSVTLKHANTGAFQRVASPPQIAAILAKPEMAGRTVLDLQPEDLPACYNAIWVKPYQAMPDATLVRWSKSGDGAFAASTGPCLAQ